LGFFALVVLVVEAVLAIAVGITEGADRTYLVLGMLALIAALILLVAAMAIWRPQSLYGQPKAIVHVNDSHDVAQRSNASDDSNVVVHLDSPNALLVDALSDGRFAEKDLKQMRRALSRVKSLVNPSLRELRDTWLRSKYDVVQIAAHVGSNGSIKLGEEELMPVALGEMVRYSETKLVVLAACDSATLTTHLAPHASMIAGTGSISSEAWDEWSSIFYSVLSAGVPLTRAYSIASAVVDLPVAMLVRNDLKLTRRR